MLVLCAVLWLAAGGAPRARAEPCGAVTSVDISSASRTGDGILVYDGVQYSPRDYYEHVEADGTRQTRGCVCRAGAAVCVRKCCPLGEQWHRKRGACVPSVGGATFSPPLQLESGAMAVLSEDRLRPASGWQLVVGRQECPDTSFRTRASHVTKSFYLRKNGMLNLKLAHTLSGYMTLPAEEFCLDTFLDTDANGTQTATFEALVCFPEDHIEDNTIASTGMVISSVFLLLTLAVYVGVPELRNMHGRVLMAYLSSLLVAFVFLSALQLAVRFTDRSVLPVCLPFTFLIYFALLAAFFWLNVMCFDIWWTFSGYSQMRRSQVFARRRYAMYCAYAFGIPSALTALLAALEFYPDVPDHIVTPQLRKQGCFIAGEAKLLYLYCPMLIVCAANALLFVMTAVRIARIRRETAVLKGGDSATHDQYRKDRQRLFLYVKLFVVMGVNWVLEVISGLFPKVPVLWKITDAYNVLIGLTIFVIFICKKKIFRLIKKRYDLARGAPPSRSQTCSTRNTSTASRDEMRLPPLQTTSPAVAP